MGKPSNYEGERKRGKKGERKNPNKLAKTMERNREKLKKAPPEAISARESLL